jgi:hypothetical protein
MILYSVMPEEIVFEGWDQQPERPLEVTVNGLLMEVQPVSHQEAKIVRLICPDPQQYLNPAYAPGQMIKYRPTLI